MTLRAAVFASPPASAATSATRNSLEWRRAAALGCFVFTARRHVASPAHVITLIKPLMDEEDTPPPAVRCPVPHVPMVPGVEEQRLGSTGAPRGSLCWS